MEWDSNTISFDFSAVAVPFEQSRNIRGKLAEKSNGAAVREHGPCCHISNRNR